MSIGILQKGDTLRFVEMRDKGVLLFVLVFCQTGLHEMLQIKFLSTRLSHRQTLGHS